jgi:hypothetical protein
MRPKNIRISDPDPQHCLCLGLPTLRVADKACLCLSSLILRTEMTSRQRLSVHNLIFMSPTIFVVPLDGRAVPGTAGAPSGIGRAPGRRYQGIVDLLPA